MPKELAQGERPQYTGKYLDEIAVAPAIGVEGLEGTDRVTPPEETTSFMRAVANAARASRSDEQS